MENEKKADLVPGDPSSLAGASEHSQQVALMAACAQYVEGVPELKWLFAVPNGGGRGVGKGAMIQGAAMKAEGAKRGVADLCLPVAKHGWHAFYLEMKRPDGKGTYSPEQQQFQAFCTQQGNLYAGFTHWHQAFRALMWYLGFEHSKRWALPS